MFVRHVAVTKHVLVKTQRMLFKGLNRYSLHNHIPK